MLAVSLLLQCIQPEETKKLNVREFITINDTTTTYAYVKQPLYFIAVLTYTSAYCTLILKSNQPCKTEKGMNYVDRHSRLQKQTCVEYYVSCPEDQVGIKEPMQKSMDDHDQQTT